jgi:hypothetical protein
LKDFVLDWEAALPEEDLEISDAQSKMADLRYIDTISASPMTVSFQLKLFEYYFEFKYPILIKFS